MRAITIKVGKKEKDCLDPKYMDGVCKVRGLAIEGDSREEIAEAEALRRRVLNKYAALMYNFYTEHSVKALDRAFVNQP